MERAPILMTEEDRAAAATVTFEAFFEQHHDRLYRALWLVTRNGHESEEIMQDAFLKLWERWERVATFEDPEAYLFRTAMNVFRSRARRASVVIRRAVGALPAEDGLAEIEGRDAVIRALAPLTAGQRAALVLTGLLGFTSEEAGRALGVRPSTVRVLAARGRATLKEGVDEADG